MAQTEAEFIDQAALSIMNGMVSNGKIGFENDKIKAAAELAYRMAKSLYECRPAIATETAPFIEHVSGESSIKINEEPKAKEVKAKESKAKEVKDVTKKKTKTKTMKRTGRGRPKKKAKEPSLKVNKLSTTLAAI